MKTIAIHQKEDWFMIQLPGYGKTVNKQMEVEVTIPDEDDNQPDYKTLRDKALLERYLEKQQREISEIRKKYPSLEKIDKFTANWVVNEPDDKLLDEFYKQRAKDEGII